LQPSARPLPSPGTNTTDACRSSHLTTGNTVTGNTVTGNTVTGNTVTGNTVTGNGAPPSLTGLPSNPALSQTG